MPVSTASARRPSAVNIGDDDLKLRVLSLPAAIVHEAAGEWQRLLDDEQLADVALVGAEAPTTAAGGSAEEPWPTLTVPATLDLPRTKALRRNTRLALACAWLFGVPTCAGMFYGAVAAPTVVGRVLFAVLAAACSIGLARWMRSRMRVARSSGSLRVTSQELRIEDAALLRAPFVIDRAQVDTIAIDDGASTTGLDPVRFPYAPSPWLHPSGDPALAASGWLWTGPHLNSVPMLGVGDETPNLLLVFSGDMPGPPLRRRRHGLPEEDAPLTGLALAVADVAGARDALAGWGVVRPLTRADAIRLTSPVPALMRDRSAISRNERRGWLLVAAGPIVPVAALFALTSIIQMWPFERLRAHLLALAALTVFVGRLGMYVGWF